MNSQIILQAISVQFFVKILRNVEMSSDFPIMSHQKSLIIDFKRPEEKTKMSYRDHQCHFIFNIALYRFLAKSIKRRIKHLRNGLQSVLNAWHNPLMRLDSSSIWSKLWSTSCESLNTDRFCCWFCKSWSIFFASCLNMTIKNGKKLKTNWKNPEIYGSNTLRLSNFYKQNVKTFPFVNAIDRSSFSFFLICYAFALTHYKYLFFIIRDTRVFTIKW